MSMLTDPFSGLADQIKRKDAEFEEWVKRLPVKKALIARCRHRIARNEILCFPSKKEKVMLAAETIENTKAIPTNTICEFMIKNSVVEEASGGYVRQVLLAKYKNLNQVAIAKRQPKGRLRTAIMHERKGRELQKEVQGLRNESI